MPRTIPPVLTVEKNRLATENPWLMLLDISLSDGETEFYLVANTENIEFQGRTYTAVAIDVALPEESTQGRLPTLSLKVSNVSRVLQKYMESLNGAVGSTVLMHFVNAGYLAEDYSDLDMEWTLLSASCKGDWITFTLGGANPLNRRCPLYRYIALHCKWQPNSAECGLTGITCARTLDACRAHGNSRRFGGYPGLAQGGVRLV